MRTVRRTSQFRRDVKRLRRRGRNMGKLKAVLVSLVEGEGMTPIIGITP